MPNIFRRLSRSAALILILLFLCPVILSAQQSYPFAPIPFARVGQRLPHPVLPLPLSPADQLADALYERDLNKTVALLQGNPNLAKTPSSAGVPPLVSITQYSWDSSEDGQKVLLDLLEDGSNVNAADLAGITPLQNVLARGYGDIRSLVLLLNNGANIERRNAEGKTPLHIAVGNSDLESIKILLRHGANVNACSRAGDTPLHIAIISQRPEIIGALLEAGANVNIRNNRGEMPIHLAMRMAALQSAYAAQGRLGMIAPTGMRRYKMPYNPVLVSQLLDRGADMNARDQSGITPLLFALLNRDKINFAVLMQRHAATDTLTAWFSAAATNNPKMLARLKKTLPDVKDLRAPDGATALHIAALWNAPACVRLLLHYGIESNVRDATQETPLHYACWFTQNILVVRLLLDSGANINAEDVYGETPLHLSVHDSTVGLMRLLIARGAVLDIPNNNGATPLALAVSQGNISLASVLLNAGADVNTHNSGDSLLSMALRDRASALPMATLLLAKGADVNYTISRQESLLMVAVQQNDRELVQLLLSEGADVNHKSSDNVSALSMAFNVNDPGIAELLKQHGAK